MAPSNYAGCCSATLQFRRHLCKVSQCDCAYCLKDVTDCTSTKILVSGTVGRCQKEFIPPAQLVWFGGSEKICQRGDIIAVRMAERISAQQGHKRFFTGRRQTYTGFVCAAHGVTKGHHRVPQTLSSITSGRFLLRTSVTMVIKGKWISQLPTEWIRKWLRRGVCSYTC